MTKNRYNLNRILIKSGFLEYGDLKNMFYVNKKGDIISVFLPSLIKKMGSVRFDGCIGLYFLDFEKRWKDSVKNNLFGHLASPVMIISISNFLDLSDNGVFHYTADESDLVASSKYIYRKCKSLPSSIVEFKNCIKLGKILDRRISEYINIYDEPYQDNPRLIKLANFFRWLEQRYDFISELKNMMLNEYQISAINTVPEDYYFIDL